MKEVTKIGKELNFHEEAFKNFLLNISNKLTNLRETLEGFPEKRRLA